MKSFKIEVGFSLGGTIITFFTNLNGAAAPILMLDGSFVSLYISQQFFQLKKLLYNHYWCENLSSFLVSNCLFLTRTTDRQKLQTTC